MELSDYYLVKCWEKKEYRDAFNSGKFYFGHVSKYWEIENTFQQDDEGMILRHEGQGYLICGNPKFNCFMKNQHNYAEIKEYADKHGLILGQTKDFSAWINGYLCCFFLLPKKDVVFHDGRMFFENDRAKEHFRVYTTRYIEDKGKAFGSIYDAVALCRVIEKACNNKGYGYARGHVTYEEIDLSQRVLRFNHKEIEKIVFSKPVKYSYQSEYRFFISTQSDRSYKPIILDGDDTSSAYIGGFDF